MSERGERNVETDDGLTRAEKKEKSRRRILDAAKEVFFRDGFMPANLDEVADRAGVAKGTLYRYFESKADLYVAVLSDTGGLFVDKMREASREGASAHEKIQSISRFYLDHWTRHAEYFRIFWAVDNQEVIGELPTAVLEAVTRLWEDSLGILQIVLDDAVAEGELGPCDTWEVANILWTVANSLIDSDMNQPRKRLRRRPLEEVYGDAISLILDGLRYRARP